MRAGGLRTPLDVEVYEEYTDEMGQIVEDWVFFTKVYGKLKNLSGDDYWAAQQAQSDVTGTMEIRYVPSIADRLFKDIEKIRLKHKGYEQVPGDTVEGGEQVVDAERWGYNKLILLQNQNYDLSEPVINSVEGNSTGYTEDQDYIKAQDWQGNWGILVYDTATTSEDHDITINYDYTPPEKEARVFQINYFFDPDECKKRLHLMVKEAL